MDAVNVFVTPAYTPVTVAVLLKGDWPHRLPINEPVSAVVAPAGTVTVAGTYSMLELLVLSETTAPPAGAAPVRCTVVPDPYGLSSVIEESDTGEVPVSVKLAGVPTPETLAVTVWAPVVVGRAVTWA